GRAGVGHGLLRSLTAALPFLLFLQAPVQLLPSSCDHPSLQESMATAHPAQVGSP
ncbi:hypothetical protein CIB84_008306, partial [Bambusicola thoracicus]